VEWRQVGRADLPEVLLAHFDATVIEGMGWKLAPLRTFIDRYELALNNDCILWDVPDGMRQWLELKDGFLFAEDMDRCFGSFDALCRPGCLNAGIRSLPPGVDLQEELRFVLSAVSEQSNAPLQLSSELEEQGLQAAMISQRESLFLVQAAEVSICSPFWPRSPEPGICGVHFVGMNAHHIPWNYYERPADVWLEEHWQRHRPALYRTAGLPLD
jgi:hypothetical protein